MSPHGVPGADERSQTGETAVPTQLILAKVEVAAARNCADVEAIIVIVPVVLAEAAKMMDCVAPVPEVLRIFKLLNAFAAVIEPESVCCEVPSRYTVPPLLVNVPLFV